MKHARLIIKHSHKGHSIKEFVLENTSKTLVIGSSKSVDIRLMGPDVGPVHAILEYRHPYWVICDLGSSTGTWVGNDSIVEQVISTNAKVQIGGHILDLGPTAVSRDLFDDKHLKTDLKTTGPVYHQVILKTKGRVLESHLLKSDEAFKMKMKGREQEFVPPSGKDIKTQEVGKITVIQRLVSDIPEAERPKFEMDPAAKWPTLGAAGLLLCLLFAIFLAPQEPNVELELPELKKNKYSRMIYSAKVVRQKKAAAVKISKKRFSKAGASSAKKVAKSPKTSGTKRGAKVVSKIKNSGLSALIGKIAKRASKNAKLIEAKGVTPDVRESARSLSSIDASSVLKGVGSGASKAFKLKGIKTSGKGGGSGAYKSGTSLSGGGVGTADVGIIEEETEVEGGLDRSIIAEVIQKYLGQIRYCYERQLSANPDLYGKVQVKFNIAGDGSVSTQNVGSSTLKSAMVEGCILRRVARWKFPQPKGGTTVKVTYPFLFKSQQ